MKILLLLITTTILASCGNSNEQKKFEINQQMFRLNLNMNKIIKQKEELKDQLTRIYLKYDTVQRNASEAERKSIQTKFVKEIETIELQQRKLEIRDLQDELELRKLEMKYAKL